LEKGNAICAHIHQGKNQVCTREDMAFCNPDELVEIIAVDPAKALTF